MVSPADFRLISLDTVDSTNSYVRRELMAGRLSGSGVVHARIQTRGRGRGDRPWESGRPHGFWGTLFLPGTDAPIFDSMVRVAVTASSVLRAHGAAAALKWPNDLYCDRKKIGGLLIEEAGGYVLAGLGVNLLQSREDFPGEISGIATSLYLETGIKLSPRDFLLEFLDGYRAVTDPERAFETFARSQVVTNTRVIVEGRVFTALSIRRDGALLGRADNGESVLCRTGTLRWADEA